MHPPEADRLITDLGDAQYGRVARWQLVRLGFDDASIRHRLSRRLLRPIRRGVYGVGHVPDSIRGRWMEDLLACGPECGLGGTTALQLFGALRENRRPTVVVTPRRGRRRPAGIVLRTSRNVDFVEWGGFRVTPLGRSLADASEVLDDEQLEAAYERAVKDHGLDPRTIPPRSARLNRLVSDHAFGTALTDSELENLFRRVLKQAGLPQPESNTHVWTGTRHYRPDFLWRDRMLIAEIDGWNVHKAQQEADSHRWADLSALGFTVQRFMKVQLVRRPQEVILALRPFL